MMAENSKATICCAMLCVACDLPAGRKVCGFLSHAANLGCSKCYCAFSTGVFGKTCYAGFGRTMWVLRSNERHRRDVAELELRPLKQNVKKGVRLYVFMSFTTSFFQSREDASYRPHAQSLYENCQARNSSSLDKDRNLR